MEYDTLNTHRARSHDLTIAEVKASPTFSHLTDEEAQQVIEALKVLTKIAYELYKNSHKNDVIPDKNPIL